MSRQVITQIGSLPFDNPRIALKYSLMHDIPFLPELPKRQELMFKYIEHPGQLCCLDGFKQHKFATVKVQCVGPATLISGGYTADQALERIYQHVLQILAGLQAEQVILFLDEPGLGQSGVDFQGLWSPIFETFDIIPGVHVCGNMDWDKLFKSQVEIISFDASLFDITRYPGYRGGKRIAWGVKKIEDVKDFQEGDLLTLSCGMSPLAYNVKDCEPELNKLREIAQKLRAQP